MRGLKRSVVSMIGALTLMGGNLIVSPVSADASAPAWAGHGHRLSAAAELVAHGHLGSGNPASNSGSACSAEKSTTGNVQVNCRKEDGTSAQNTQSETSVAAFGKKVVVGFNDSLVCCTALNLSGYAVSTDGGKTFTDQGDLPWSATVQPLGDPSVVTDPDGNFYYSSLAAGGTSRTAPSLLAVYKMGKGSNVFKLLSVPVNVGDSSKFFADKEYLAVGKDGSNKLHFYLTWTFFSQAVPSPIYLSDSTDGIHWRQTRVAAANACSQASNPVPHGATLYVSWEQAMPQACGNPSPFGTVMMATVNVATAHVTRITTVAPIFGSGDAIVACNSPGDLREVIETAPGHDVRLFELPSTTIDHNGVLYAVWNDRVHGIGGGPANATRIWMSYSRNGNATWSRPVPISGPNPAGVEADRFQPWVIADANGLHAMWYQRVHGVPEDTIRTDREDLTLATSTMPPVPGAEVAISSVSFPVVTTNPNQDPIISNCYMGDYNNITSSGGTRYVTWGDNRNRVATTRGTENQPDVFFASY